jgi:hypothetical protein
MKKIEKIFDRAKKLCGSSLQRPLVLLQLLGTLFKFATLFVLKAPILLF